MNIIIKPDGGAIYEQIIDGIRFAILSGELKKGDPLPSMRALASELRVSVITTKRAYEELERLGIIESMVGRGSFVKGGSAKDMRKEGIKQIRAAMASALAIADKYGIEKDLLHDMLKVLTDGEEK